jgi:hypothetical protein
VDGEVMCSVADRRQPPPAAASAPLVVLGRSPWPSRSSRARVTQLPSVPSLTPKSRAT